MINIDRYHIITKIVLPYYISRSNEVRARHSVARECRESLDNLGLMITATAWPLELPHPIMPLHKAIGPILAQPGKPLPEVWHFHVLKT